MKLIINADDAGMHPAVGRAIKALAEKGMVTSASIVATGIDVETAAQLEGVDLGIHLDILRGRPLAHWQYVNSIVDKNGSFLENPVSLFKLYAMGKVDHDQVETEWSAQIERVLDYGVKPTHLSSHKHVHAWPSLTRMAGVLAKKYGIDWVRKPEDCSEISRLDKDGINSKFLNVCGLFTRETTDVNWTDFLWPIEDDAKSYSPRVFAKYYRESRLRDDSEVVEICCRPGVTMAGDPPIPSYCNPTQIASVWQTEFESLMNDDWNGVFKDLDLEKTHFQDMAD